ncbi:hypothetical protein GYMLUDRAFT_247244 [Collybiopsis luxurians FD-317 M1]|uniref:Uncharacterized protein n=1 Tax=Collybiopsis luxurians FD-317 M1 TaxID=944289 RepID=A0A0D0CGI0_9AGAR|nr:hypothetical protein GYMLUDRAFT_247244 [Collybiopsis luxurians FD-317 M1]
MILGPRTYLCLLAGFEYASLFGLRLRGYQPLEGLAIDSMLIIWLPLSIWLSLYLLGQYATEIHTAMPSASLPLHRTVRQDSQPQGTRNAAEILKTFVVLFAFGHAWLTSFHLFTVIVEDYSMASGCSLVPSITWMVVVAVAMASLFLIIGFGKCLLAFGIKQDFKHWGYFLYLHRITSFLLSAWSLFLWIIDLLEGRTEVVQARSRRE